MTKNQALKMSDFVEILRYVLHVRFRRNPTSCTTCQISSKSNIVHFVSDFVEIQRHVLHVRFRRNPTSCTSCQISSKSYKKDFLIDFGNTNCEGLFFQ